MMNYAREINPDLYLNAELSTGNVSIDHHFISSLGIHSLVRKSYRALNPSDLGELISIIGRSNPTGQLVKLNILSFQSTKSYLLFYDQTPENCS